MKYAIASLLLGSLISQGYAGDQTTSLNALKSTVETAKSYAQDIKEDAQDLGRVRKLKKAIKNYWKDLNWKESLVRGAVDGGLFQTALNLRSQYTKFTTAKYQELFLPEIILGSLVRLGFDFVLPFDEKTSFGTVSSYLKSGVTGALSFVGSQYIIHRIQNGGVLVSDVFPETINQKKILGRAANSLVIHFLLHIMSPLELYRHSKVQNTKEDSTQQPDKTDKKPKFELQPIKDKISGVLSGIVSNINVHLG